MLEMCVRAVCVCAVSVCVCVRAKASSYCFSLPVRSVPSIPNPLHTLRDECTINPLLALPQTASNTMDYLPGFHSTTVQMLSHSFIKVMVGGSWVGVGGRIKM